MSEVGEAEQTGDYRVLSEVEGDVEAGCPTQNFGTGQAVRERRKVASEVWSSVTTYYVAHHSCHYYLLHYLSARILQGTSMTYIVY